MFWLLQVRRRTEQRCLLLASATPAQSGSASSTTSVLSETMNNELTVQRKGARGCVRKPLLWLLTHTLIRIATTMHGLNSGIHTSESRSIRGLSYCVYNDFPQTIGTQPFLLILLVTLQDKLVFSIWSKSDHTSEHTHSPSSICYCVVWSGKT